MALIDSLTNYYKFDVDSSTQLDNVSGEDLTVTSATFTSSGHINNAYVFDGVNDVMETTAFSNVTTAYSISMWGVFDSSSTNSNRTIFDSSATGFNQGIRFVYNTSSNKVRLEHDAAAFSESGALSVEGTTYHHIVITWNTTRLKIFVDGVLNKDNAYTATLTDGGQLLIGKSRNASGWFLGKMDEIAYWTKTLSDGGVSEGETATGEVASLYNSGAGRQYPFTTLTVDTPNGGEVLIQGDSFAITWSDTGSVSDVKLEYSVNSGSSYTDIVASTPDDGTFDWTVPVEVSTTVLVRVSEVGDSGNSDVSDAVFSILAPVKKDGKGGGFVQSWLLIVKSILDGSTDKIIELSNPAIRDYLFTSPHVQITGDFQAKVVKVHDGDTITLHTSFRDFDFPLRIANIDALELNNGGGPTQVWLEERLLGKTVDVLINPKNRVGKYGRLIGEVFVGGMNVGDEMLRRYMVAPFGEIRHRIEPLSKILQEGRV